MTVVRPETLLNRTSKQQQQQDIQTKPSEETTSSTGPKKKKGIRFLPKLIKPSKQSSSSPTATTNKAAPTPTPTPPRVVNVNSPRTTSTSRNITTTTTTKNAFHKKKSQNVVVVTVGGKSSWLSRTKFFRKMSDWAFDVVDQDESGTVDEKELYSGLLLIHLKLGCYAGPAACRPVDRKQVHQVFMKMDVDDSGSLDKKEFCDVMTVLCSNVLTRVMVQWSMTLIIVPFLAQSILNAIYFVNTHFWQLIMNLDEYSTMANQMELWIEHCWARLIDKIPKLIVTVCHMVAILLHKVPDSVWNTVPLTLLSCILGGLAVPYLIFKVDDYFQSMADQKKNALQRVAKG